MTYELAKELKEAGFWNNRSLFSAKDKVWNDSKSTFEYVPTLEELIAACDVGFKKLWRHSNNTWSAYSGTLTGRDTFQRDGATPTEAVARLWLALQKL